MSPTVISKGAGTGQQIPIQIPDATNLSWLAETADGKRGQTLYLIKDDQDKLQLVTQTELKGRSWLAVVETPKNRPHRGQVSEVACRGQYEGKDFELELKHPDYDAVFWTESSIEKFLYPYYRSHRIWDDKIEQAKRKFDTYDSAVAMAHRAPSTSETLSYDTIRVGVADPKSLTLEWMTVDAFLALP
jgi:hypothetical protein